MGPACNGEGGIPGGYEVQQITAGVRHTCMIVSNNTISRDMYCWGDGQSGQLGAGDNESSSTPVRVAMYLNQDGGEGEEIEKSWDSVSLGDVHTCGLLEEDNNPDLALYCWGDNYDWQYGDGGYCCGNGGSEPSNTPVEIALEPQWDGPRQLSIGGSHACLAPRLAADAHGGPRALRIHRMHAPLARHQHTRSS